MRNERLQNTLFAAAALAVIAWLSWNLSSNLEARGITIDYGFLWNPTTFAIGESLIPFGAGDSYFRAFVVGLLNTLKLAIVAIVLSTVLGVIIGLAGRASHPQLRGLAKAWVEITRNTPLLLILVVCATLVRALPNAKQAWSLGESVHLSSRGLYLPLLRYGDAGPVVAVLALIGLVGLIFGWRAMRRGRAALGHLPGLSTSVVTGSALLLAGLFLYGLIWGEIDRPVMKGFNFQGGFSLTPEYLAMLFGLSFYISGFIAEIVRSSLEAIPKGQGEAAQALGLSPRRALWLVQAPQAVRLMLPSLANQYLNTTKNTTIAILIGYPELVSVGNTALVQAGHAIETVTIYLMVYLFLSLVTSFIIKGLEKRARLVKS